MSIAMPEPAPTARGPVRPGGRALAPDLARGAMLLFIALANAAGVALGGPGAEPDPEGLERAVNLFLFTFVHARAYPVFGVMFGYGLVQLARRQEEAGAPPEVVRGVLQRRNAWLVAFGFVHASLLYYGDFLAAYGLAGLAASWLLLRRGERVQRVVLWMWGLSVAHVFVLAAQVVARLAKEGVESARVPAGTVGSLVAPDYLTAALARLAEWPLHTLTVLPFIVIVWLGMWAARRRLLEDPSHVRWLRRVAATGLGLAVLGGLPLALVGAGMMRAGAAEVGLMLRLQLVSGMFAGPGYVAVFGLVAFGLTRPGAPPIPGVARALASLGRRSLSAYLFQSVAWLLLLSPYTLALGRRFRSPMITAEAVALLVWLATLAGAAALERRSRSGPAESLLRRLTYGSSR